MQAVTTMSELTPGEYDVAKVAHKTVKLVSHSHGLSRCQHLKIASIYIIILREKTVHHCHHNSALKQYATEY